MSCGSPYRGWCQTGSASSQPAGRSGTRELVARALAAAVVVSLLAVSGAGGADVQTPKRGGTVVFGPVREPACLATFLPICRGVALTPAFDGSARTLSRRRTSSTATSCYGRGSSRMSTHDSAAVHPHLSPSPQGPLERRAAITARDFVFSRNVIRRSVASDSGDIHLQVRSVRAVDAEDGRSSFAPVRLAGGDSSGPCSRSMRSRASSSPRSGRTGSTTRRRAAHRQRPFPRGTLGARQAAHARPKSATTGEHVAHLDRIVIRFCKEVCNAPPAAEVLERLRQGEVDFAFARDTGISPTSSGSQGSRFLQGPRMAWSTSTSGPDRKPPRAPEQERRRALVYGIDRVALVRRLFGEIDRSIRRATVPSS